MKRAIRDLSPAYFALVMATGIVSIAAHLYDMPAIADILFAGNIVAFLVLLVLTGLRLLWFPRAFFADIADHQRGPGNLTLVAGSCVLGSQFVLIARDVVIADALWAVSVVLWIVLIYGIFAALSVKRDKPSLAQGINGGWLLAVVSTQAIAVLGALIAPHWPQPYRLELNFVVLSMWLWGGMLYIWMAALIFYRYAFFDFAPGDLSPPYWINMGAMAISTLAGSLLILNAPDAPFVESVLPFVRGFTIFYWATGTWWIPMLVVLALWLVCTYGIFAALTVKLQKPTLEQGINGGWLLAVVSTQGIAVLSALIAAHWPQPYRVELNFLALSMWLW
ncbi:MAG TPA: tellurite resistance/C4-dicarboxylate transporter family protein, partial [Acetobacteraceae bacterium]|nr:tellurite resistance/C4-dicarboxylate transporter family protein [Acetobacteraceae bacterium]